MRLFFNTCIAIEKTIGEIYRQMAATVSGDDEIKAIWQKMAKEEDQHAMEIGFAARLPNDGTFRMKDLTMERVVQMHDFAKRSLEKVKVSPPSRKAAVKLTLKLEKELLEVHIQSCVDFESESMRKMFKSIVQGDENHCLAIREYHARHFSD